MDDVPRLEGTGVILRDVRHGDAATRAALGRRREIVRGFGGDIAEDAPMTEEEATFELGHRFGPGPHWVIADHTDTFLGILRLAPVDTANRSARLGVGIFDPDRLGRGLGTEAMRLALSYGFGSLGLHRVSLTVLADNARAVAAYTALGFQTEGRLRETLWRDGRWCDDLTMAVLAADWA